MDREARIREIFGMKKEAAMQKEVMVSLDEIKHAMQNIYDWMTSDPSRNIQGLFVAAHSAIQNLSGEIRTINHNELLHELDK